jgi:uncharacterized repeat protein (TIGR03806 family)
MASLIGLLLLLHAASPADECRWTDGPIIVDGKADEPAWKHAAIVDRFGQPWLGTKGRISNATRARLLWDREHLYFFADMDDADLFAAVKEHDGRTWLDDCFEFFLKPSSANPGYYEFHVTAGGVLMDMFIPDRATWNYDNAAKRDRFHWKAKIEVKGTLNHPGDRDSGWCVEGRIPWSDLAKTGGRPKPGDEWRYSLCRYEYDAGGRNVRPTTISPLTKYDFHRHEEFATLKFVGPRESPGAKAAALPALGPPPKSNVVGSPDPPPPFRTRRAYERLRPNFPIAARLQPGTKEFVFIDEAGPYAPTKLRRTKGGPETGEFETLLDVPTGVAYDLCFHPKFARNGFLFLSVNEPIGPDKKHHTRIKRYALDRRPPHRLDPKSETVIIEWPSGGHNGGALAFADDGLLFVTSGDGTSDSDPDLAGQDLTKLTAKVLRIDIDRTDGGRNYSVPKDNPFLGAPGARPETWAFGLRNPWRMAFDPATRQLWVAQNGQDHLEQVYLVERGGNYGWSVVEGSRPFYVERKRGPGPILPPSAEHPHSEARSLTGGFVYRGKRFPELVGAYLYGDYSTGRLWGVRHDGEKARVVEIARSRLMITGFAQDEDGEVLILDHRGGGAGGFHTLERTPASNPSNFPTQLSDTGLFKKVSGHVMHPGAIPYDVAAPFWSDGADKARWLVLPPGGKIGHAPSKGWNFPDLTVLVKSFATTENTATGPKTKWFETRLLTKQEGEWVGYSYRWNDGQTDAELVPAAGMEVAMTIDGRMTTWRYPSRTECMMCHSRAANYVLGPSDAQMNVERVHGGTRINQIEAFEAWGLFETPLLASLPAERLRLVDPYSDGPPLERRARSWLHANCSFCHVKEGGGNARMELDVATATKDAGLIGVRPMHPLAGAAADACIVTPGEASKSTLLERLRRRPPHQTGGMPPLATNAVDERAVQLIDEWIRTLPKDAPAR